MIFLYVVDSQNGTESVYVPKIILKDKGNDGAQNELPRSNLIH